MAEQRFRTPPRAARRSLPSLNAAGLRPAACLQCVVRTNTHEFAVIGSNEHRNPTVSAVTMMMENGVMNNHYGGGYEDGYMEQEEEWEREGLLDPAWEKQQKKVSSPELC